MFISIFTGLAAGVLHVIGGVDHFVAIAPSVLRRKPISALRVAISWGVGHSTGVLLLSLIAILVKDLAPIERISSFAELCVGIVLLVIGVIAVRTSLGLNIHSHSHVHKDGSVHEHLHVHFLGDHKHIKHNHASTTLGILHGLAGASHLLVVIPALALPPSGAVLFMIFYLLATVVTMTIIVLVISQVSLKAGIRLMPALIGSTGFISILIGFFWIHKTSAQFL